MSKTPINRQVKDDNPTFEPASSNKDDLTNNLQKINDSTIPQPVNQQQDTHFMQISLGLIGLEFEPKKSSDDFEKQLATIVRREVDESNAELSK